MFRTAAAIALAMSLAACDPAPVQDAPAAEAPVETADAAPPAEVPAPAVSCTELRARLDATPLPADMAARVAESDVAKLGGPMLPAVFQYAPPILPQDLADLHANAVCDLVFDVDETGTARTPQARCSNPAFEYDALTRLGAMRFEPYTLNGRALPVSGLIMPMEYCNNA